RLLASSLQVEFHIAADDMADAQALASTLDETSINTALVSQGLPAATVVRSAAVFVVYADGPGIVIPDSECVECSGEPNTLDNCTWVCPETTAVFTNSSTNVTACLECTWPCDAGQFRSACDCLPCANWKPPGQFRSACDCLPCANWKPPGAHYSGPGSEASFNQCQWACDDGLPANCQWACDDGMPANETHGEECGIFCSAVSWWKERG
ncbi:hypothetical protein T484DRAFT_1838460, partial [Baffinella frigidus]